MKYGVSLFFIGKSEPPEEPLWEESIILLEADSKSDALTKAKALGEKESHSYLSVEGKRVT